VFEAKTSDARKSYVHKEKVQEEYTTALRGKQKSHT
jgi:hypothetical protein